MGVTAPMRRVVALNGLTALALPLAAIITSPLLARALGADGRGEMAATMAPAVLAATVATAGLPDALTFFIARRPAAVRRYAILALLICGVLGGIAFAGLLLAAPVLMRNFPAQQSLMIMIAATLPLNLAAGALRGVAQGLHRFDLINRERVFSVLCRVTLLVVFLVAGHLTVTTAVWITWGTGIAAAVCFAPMAKTVVREPASPPERGLLQYGFRAWVGSAAGLLVLRLDTVLLAMLATPRQVGYYAVAVALAEVPHMVVASVRQIVLAAAAHSFDAAMVAKATRITVLLTLGTAFGGALLVPVLIPPLFGAEFEPAVLLTQVLLLATVAASINAIVGASLAALGRPGAHAWSQLTGLVVTVAVLLALVGPLGALGAAIASVAAYTVSATVSCVLLVRFANLGARRLLVPTKTDAAEVGAFVSIMWSRHRWGRQDQ